MIRYRLVSTPTRSLPLNVRSAGHYRFPAGHREPRGPGNFLQMFWSVAGDGWIVVGGRNVEIPAGSLFYYAAGEPHDLTAGAAGWEYRWLTFDGAGFKRIVAEHGFKRVQPVNVCPAGLFDGLDDALRDPTPEGETKASVLAYEILLRAGEAVGGPLPSGELARGAEAVRAWLDAHYADARLNVAAMALKFGLHRSSLHRVFTRSHGVAPVRYLARLRLRRGLELLATTVMPVADVAVRCGLPDVAYFSKLVSRHTGYSPREYRRRQAGATQGAVTGSGLAKSPGMS
jgi:AraC-like DNA-binding protein